MLRLSAAALLLASFTTPAPSESTLAREPSPYLRERAGDPLEWRGWDAAGAALERARRERRLVLLAVGGGGCGLCRERERELFRDPEAAREIGRSFVALAVDADEHPEVADVFLSALALDADAAAPDPEASFVSVLSPDGWPLWGAELPAEPPRRAALAARLTRWAVDYRDDGGALEARAGARLARLREAQAGEPARGPLGSDVVTRAVAGVSGRGDVPLPAWRLLLAEPVRRRHREALAAATRGLDALAAGGTRDHVGGGFFHGPRGEPGIRLRKDLADNAILLRASVQAHEATGSPAYREAAEGIAGWVRRELADPAGGFRVRLGGDADDARFYAWTREQVLEALGPREGARLLDAFTLEPDGLPRPSGRPAGSPAFALRELLERRAARPRPAADPRITAGGNGLMIGALALSGAVLGRPDDLDAARAAAGAVLSRLGPASALRRCGAGGETRGAAGLQDHALLAEGLLDLHDATGEPRWRAEAVALVEAALARFLDVERGGFYATDAAHGPLPVRLRDAYDVRLPSGNGVMAAVLLRVGALTGETRFAELGRRTVEAFRGDLQRAPGGLETLAAAAASLAPAPAPPSPAPAARAERISRGPITVEASLSHGSARPGELIEARVRLSIEPKWFVAARDPLDRNLAGLSVSLLGDEVQSSAPRYPAATAVRAPFSSAPLVAVLQDEAVVVLPLRLPAQAAPGPHRIRLAVRYQPCSERDCRAPERAVLEVPIAVVSP